MEFLNDKNILIIGPPGSGKSFLAKILKTDFHDLICTDDYLQYNNDKSLTKILNDLSVRKKKVIVEGCLGYRMLRKGYCPDVVIEIEMDDNQKKKVNSLRNKDYSSFNKANRTILDEYTNSTTNKPIWLKIQNKWL